MTEQLTRNIGVSRSANMGDVWIGIVFVLSLIMELSTKRGLLNLWGARIKKRADAYVWHTISVVCLLLLFLVEIIKDLVCVFLKLPSWLSWFVYGHKV